MKESYLLDYFIKNTSSIPYLFEILSEDQKKDKAFIIGLLEKNVEVFNYLDKEQQEDKGIFMEYLKHDTFLINFNVYNKLLDDKQNVLEFLEVNYNLFNLLSKEHQENKDVFRKYLEINKFLYAFNCNNELLNDKECVMEFLEINSNVYNFLSKEMQEEKEVLKKYLCFNETLFGFNRDNKLLNDKECVMEFLEINPNVYNFLSEEIKNDEQIVRKYVKQNYFTCRFRGTNLIKIVDVSANAFSNSNINVVKPFLANSCFPNCFMNLLSNKDSVMELLDVNLCIYDIIDDKLKFDMDILDKLFLKSFLVHFQDTFFIFCKYVKDNIDFAKVAVIKNNLYYYYLSEEVRNEIDNMNILPNGFTSYEEFYNEFVDDTRRKNIEFEKNSDPIDFEELMKKIDMKLDELNQEEF